MCDQLSEYGKDCVEREREAQLEVCRQVMIWTKTPGSHGKNPYSWEFVRLADKVMEKHFNNPDYTLDDLNSQTR